MDAKIRTSALLLLLNIAIFHKANASQPQGWGRVNILGTIVETACAIDTASRDQTIDMGLMPIGQLINAGQSINRPFAIQLVNCTLTSKNNTSHDWQHFQVTFDGNNDSGLFNISGDAQGISLQIIDSDGNIASPGVPLPKRNPSPGDVLLQYSLRLVSNHQLLRAGEYFSTVKFKMDYY